MFLKELWLRIISAVASHKAKHNIQWDPEKNSLWTSFYIKLIIGELCSYFAHCWQRFVTKGHRAKTFPLCVWHTCPYSNGWSVFAPLYLLTRSSKEQMQNFSHPFCLGTCCNVTETGLTWIHICPLGLQSIQMSKKLFECKMYSSASHLSAILLWGLHILRPAVFSLTQYQTTGVYLKFYAKCSSYIDFSLWGSPPTPWVSYCLG